MNQHRRRRRRQRDSVCKYNLCFNAYCRAILVIRSVLARFEENVYFLSLFAADSSMFVIFSKLPFVPKSFASDRKFFSFFDDSISV